MRSEEKRKSGLGAQHGGQESKALGWFIQGTALSKVSKRLLERSKRHSAIHLNEYVNHHASPHAGLGTRPSKFGEDFIEINVKNLGKCNCPFNLSYLLKIIIEFDTLS